MIINPYLDQGVTIGKEYYDYKGESSHQEKSIVYYDGTYMQNSGIAYKHNEKFEVVSILDGTVIEITENEGETFEKIFITINFIFSSWNWWSISSAWNKIG